MMEETIVYKRGEADKKDVGEILQSILVDDLQVALNKMQAGIDNLNKHLERTEFEGYLGSKTISVSDNEQVISLKDDWHIKPWIGCTFLNGGPDTAYILINYKGDWVILIKNIPLNIDFAGSEERIKFIRHKCDSGNTASVTVVGKY